jgi:hypothetical protein
MSAETRPQPARAASRPKLTQPNPGPRAPLHSGCKGTSDSDRDYPPESSYCSLLTSCDMKSAIDNARNGHFVHLGGECWLGWDSVGLRRFYLYSIRGFSSYEQGQEIPDGGKNRPNAIHCGHRVRVDLLEMVRHANSVALQLGCLVFPIMLDLNGSLRDYRASILHLGTTEWPSRKRRKRTSKTRISTTYTLDTERSGLRLQRSRAPTRRRT